MDDKNKTERLDFSQLNDAAKKAIENVAKAAVKAGKAITSSLALTNYYLDKTMAEAANYLEKLKDFETEKADKEKQNDRT